MTVDSQNTEAVSSRTKPTMNYPQSFAESVLTCPKCGEAMDPMVLGMNDDGTQKAWWTCSGVKKKKCTFPLDMPQDIYWVTRSVQDIEKNEVPPPNVQLLPVRYQHLYPSLFQTSRKITHGSRQGSHESTRSISSMDSGSSPNSSSIWDRDSEDTAKSRTAYKLDAMRKPKVVIAQQNTFIPSITGGNRALAFAESFNKKDEQSTTLTTRLKLGGGFKKVAAETREMAKKSVIKMLAGVDAAEFKRIAPSKVAEMKRAVIEHVKRRRAEREQLAELQRMNEKRNKAVDIDELVKAKLLKNKREYEQRRIQKAREARIKAARVSRTASLSKTASFSMPGYEEEPDEGHQSSAEAAAYATTPPYMEGAGSPGPSSYHHQDEGHFPNNDYDFIGLDSVEQSDELPSEASSSTAGSPFTELGPLQEEDLAGIEINPDFEHAFAEAFGDDFADEFADMSHYN